MGLAYTQNNKDLSIRNYTQHFLMTYKGKESEEEHTNHFVVQQKLIQHFKATILQNQLIKDKTKQTQTKMKLWPKPRLVRFFPVLSSRFSFLTSVYNSFVLIVIQPFFLFCMWISNSSNIICCQTILSPLKYLWTVCKYQLSICICDHWSICLYLSSTLFSLL